MGRSSCRRGEGRLIRSWRGCVAGSPWPSILAIVVAAAVLVAIAGRLDWSTLASLRTAPAWGLLAGAALSYLLTVPLKAAAWRYVLAASLPGRRSVPLRLMLPPVMIGALLNLVLVGRVGEAARVLLVHSRLRRARQPVAMSVVVGSAVTESLVSTATWAGLVATAGLLLPLPAAVWIGVAGLAAGWMLIVVASARNWGSARTTSASGRRVRRVLASIHRVWDAVAHGHRALRRPAVLVPLLGTSIGGWLAQCVSTWALLRAFGIDGGWEAAILVTVTVTVAQTLPLLPGNVGIFQAAAALPLVTSYGVPPATALAFGVVMQLVQTAPIALVGALALTREGESIRHLYASARRLRSGGGGDGGVKARAAQSPSGVRSWRAG